MDEETAAQVRELVTKGATGGHALLPHRRRHKTYAELKDRRASSSPRSPIEQPYGIDFGLRDPFGNHIRIAQLTEG